MDGLSPLELRHLRTLVEIRDKATESKTLYTSAVEDYMLELNEAGLSFRVIGAAIGIGKSTVEDWVNNARDRRGS
jgi:transposase